MGNGVIQAGKPEPRVAVLMAVFEDTRFLPEQLASIRDQDHRNIEVAVSQDCRSAAMRRVLDEHRGRFAAGRFSVRQGPGRGSSGNFMSLLLAADIEADYFAFSDQDDIWERDKLSRAVAALQGAPPESPALYTSRTRLIDEDGRTLGLSRGLGRRRPGFRHALAQNITSGNSMVMNRAARDLLCAARVTDVPHHDWWTYLLVSGAGGTVIFDEHPTLRYRQHDRNLTGVPINLRARLARNFSETWANRIRPVNEANFRALERARHFLSAENRRVFDRYRRTIREPFPGRLIGLWRSGVYRHSWVGDMEMYVVVLMNRF